MTWNSTAATCPPGVSTHQLIEFQAGLSPEAVAVRFAGKCLTYRELNARADQLAHYLHTLGVGPEVPVAICLERSLEMLVAVLGVLKAGGAYVPLDPGFPTARLAFMLKDSGAQVVLTQNSLLDLVQEMESPTPVAPGSRNVRQELGVSLDLGPGLTVPAILSGVRSTMESTQLRASPSTRISSVGEQLLEAKPTLVESKPKRICMDVDWPAMTSPFQSGPTVLQTSQSNSAPAASTPAGSTTAYILYTSGSTGKPKGVQIPHRALVNFLQSMQQTPGISAQDKLLAVTTLSFDIAGLELLLPLTVGAEVIIAPKETTLDPNALGRLMAETNASIVQATPATWRALLDSGWPGQPGLKILCGGEAWSEELAASLLPKCASLWNMYGPTETTIWSAVSKVEPGRPVVIGRPIANTRFYVLDPHQQPLPVGVPGELYIGGEGLALGYWKRPDLTAERFVAHAFGRLYRTGDRVQYRPDGTLQFLGRLDHQVKIRGFRIELEEIEAALLTHPSVQQCVITAWDDPKAGKQLVTYVVARSGNHPNSTDFRQHLRSALPEYMVPVSYVLLDRLPLTPNGKIDRKALPPPDQAIGPAAKTRVAPRTMVEETLARIWKEVLGCSEVGVYDDFFELGGHSLTVTRVISRLRSTMQIDLPLRTFFETSTLAGLAAVIERILASDIGAATENKTQERLLVRPMLPAGAQNLSPASPTRSP